MYPTPYSALNQVLSALVSRQQAILGQDFTGAYLQGSFATGDFDEHSDVDFIVVLERDLSAEQVGALQVIHDRVYRLDSRWAQHLEGSYFPRKILRHPTRRGRELWYLDNGARSLIRSSHCNTILVRWVVREKGIALAGPPPETLVEPVPAELLRADIFETLLQWGQEILANPAKYNNRFYQTYIVLSYCRMLHDLQTGANGSKREGAAWAKANLDPSWAGLIDRTWAGRPYPEVKVRQPADPQDFEKTLAFVRYIMDESRRYMRRHQYSK